LNAVDADEDVGFGPEGAFAGLGTSTTPDADPRLTQSASSATTTATTTTAPTGTQSVFAGSASANSGAARTEGTSNGGATATTATPAPKRRGWIFSASYYQQFFDVDTEDVQERVMNVFTAPHRGNFLEGVVKGNPDLYVPIWGGATLVFLTALGSAWGKYNTHKNAAWDFDASTVSLSAALIYGYVFVWSLIVYLTLTCYAGVENLRVIDVWCLYGYSILAFIPVCILATVPVELFRWLFTGACAALSTLFLMSNVRQRVLTSTKGSAFGVSFVSFIGSANFAFALVLKLFFFQYYYGH
jgi:protein YIPF1/2